MSRAFLLVSKEDPILEDERLRIRRSFFGDASKMAPAFGEASSSLSRRSGRASRSSLRNWLGVSEAGLIHGKWQQDISLIASFVVKSSGSGGGTGGGPLRLSTGNAVGRELD